MKTTIRRLASSIGVTADAIRHYRQIGLLRPSHRENGYYDYTQDDALSILLTREMRTYGMPLEFIREAYDSSTMDDYNDLLRKREEELMLQAQMIHLELSRMKETRVYASCGVRLLGQVEEFDGPPTWSISAMDRQNGFIENGAMEQWVERFPFTYVSAAVPLEELLEKRGRDPYDVRVGAGALIHYVEKFALPLPEGALFQPGGHFIRTCVRTRDVFTLCPEDLSPLTDYAREHRYAFASCTGGRLLFLNNEEEPVYYLLVWVRVEPRE